MPTIGKSGSPFPSPWPFVSAADSDPSHSSGFLSRCFRRVFGGSLLPDFFRGSARFFFAMGSLLAASLSPAWNCSAFRYPQLEVRTTAICRCGVYI
jgi:hypothetical protein